MADRQTRSSHYQASLLEICVSPETLAERSEQQGIGASLNSIVYNEELMDLHEQLIKAFWRLVDTNLTERQKSIFHLLSKGFTQQEVASQLKINQSSVCKSTTGNVDYAGGKKVIYGGAKRRLLKIASEDQEIQKIFARIAEIKSNE